MTEPVYTIYSSIDHRHIYCKAFGHAWTPGDVEMEFQPRYSGTVIEAVVCTRCGTERCGEFSITTGAQYGYYKYNHPSDWPTAQNMEEKLKRRDWKVRARG